MVGLAVAGEVDEEHVDLAVEGGGLRVPDGEIAAPAVDEDEGGLGAVLGGGEEFVVDFEVVQLCEVGGGFLQDVGVGGGVGESGEQKENWQKQKRWSGH